MAYISYYRNGLCLIEDEHNTFDLCDFSWYIGNVSERVAKKILLTHAKTPGSFLVLDSSRSDADYALLVNNGSLIFHHDVRVFPDNSCLVGSTSFKDLSSAVYYYTKHRINGVFLYDPTMYSEEYDIGPPPRVVLEDEEEVTPSQNTKDCVAPDNSSESNLDMENRTRTQKCEQSSFQKYSNTSPSGFDLGSLTCIGSTKISPGFSSFETFKPKAAQDRKLKCDSPVHKPSQPKTVSDTQKSLPESRLPKPKIYTSMTSMKIKPQMVRRSAQFNLSSLTSIKKEDDITKPKKVPPPVPPRRSSLLSFSKTSLEEYADKLGCTEASNTNPQAKTEKSKSSCTEPPQVKAEKIKSSSKEPVNRSNQPTRTESSFNEINSSSKSENCNKLSLRQDHTVEKSARPHFLTNQPFARTVNKKTQMTRHASYESTEKNGQVVMIPANSELEKVYKRITRLYDWNSPVDDVNLFSSSSSSSSCSLGSSNTHDCISPRSTSNSPCGIHHYQTTQANNAINSSPTT